MSCDREIFNVTQRRLEFVGKISFMDIASSIQEMEEFKYADVKSEFFVRMYAVLTLDCNTFCDLLLQGSIV